MATVMFETKDSGKRVEFESGMVRDTEEGKARFDLLFPLGVPYEAQMLTRFAELMSRGAEKYNARNWEKARGEAELSRYRSSALRHLVQWANGKDDEDHAAAVMFNVMAGETVKYKMAHDADSIRGLIAAYDEGVLTLDECMRQLVPAEQAAVDGTGWGDRDGSRHYPYDSNAERDAVDGPEMC